ncbi:serine O-acetyltransferase [Hydrogenophaga sp. XSHU_21]
MTSHEHPDWSREHLRPGEWSPGKRLIACIRDHQRLQQGHTRLRRWRLILVVLRHRLWSAISGADIPLNCKLGGGLLLPHPNGVVIHPDASIGPNCLIFQQVTIGTVESGGTPVIGGHVDIGAGAKVLGGIAVGHHAKIGANAVVMVDVPDGAVAVGIPARVIEAKREATRHG